MLDYTLENVTLSVVHDTRREKKDGLFPVKYRVYCLQKTAYYPCMDLTVQEWESLHKRGKRSPYQQKTKKLIVAGHKKIKDHIDDLVTAGEFSFEALSKRLSKGVKDSILDAFDSRINDLIRDGKIGSSVWYSCALNSIKSYTKKELKFADITVNWLKNFEAHLIEEGRSFTTVSMYMRALRAIINEGLKNNIINQAQYPFVIKKNGKYKIPEEAGRKMALTAEQLYAVFEHPITHDAERWRDLWVFSFYCQGANMSDILRFKYKNIIGENIEWYREKTISTDKEKRKIRAFITDEMHEIIKQHGNPEKPNNYIFPYLQDGLTPIDERKVIQNVTHNINKLMHKIGTALKIGNITTYWARHTWSNLQRMGGTSLYAISKGLGHKSLKTTSVYLDSLSDDELKKVATILPKRNGKK